MIVVVVPERTHWHACMHAIVSGAERSEAVGWRASKLAELMLQSIAALEAHCDCVLALG